MNYIKTDLTVKLLHDLQVKSTVIYIFFIVKKTGQNIADCFYTGMKAGSERRNYKKRKVRKGKRKKQRRNKKDKNNARKQKKVGKIERKHKRGKKEKGR